MSLEDGFDYLLGQDLNGALKMIEAAGLNCGGYYYRSSGEKRFTVLDVKSRLNNEGKQELILFVAGKNPVDHLPSIYQENRFLEKFLWIFQHLQYEQVRTLDSLHTYFTPREAPVEFLHWLASWFGMDLEKNFYDEETVRALLQKGLSLFQWRGTVRGLTTYLTITTDVEPEIHENTFPHGDFVILGDKSLNEAIRNHAQNRVPFFTVHFPVPMSRFTQADKSRIASIVEQEKPAHSMYYITFEKEVIKRSKGILIQDDQMLIRQEKKDD
ncbi:MAG: phage tail protein [Spirochaetales bacterium]|nr:phage tail protein [Spirochaetales bacterium]